MGRRSLKSRVARLVVVAVIGMLGPVATPADPAPPGVAAGVAGLNVAPIKCWWRTNAGAVRIGEVFSVVLTCAVLEDASTVVVPDQARLEPAVLAVPPFEVVGGTHAADLRTGDRRFFQHQYSLRLIKENLFNKDVEIPGLQITYRIRTLVRQNASVQGIEQTYVMPAQVIHVQSLVPAAASDIRDAPAGTFGDIDALLFRANVLRVIAGTLFTIAALPVILALVPLVRRYREPSATIKRLIPDGVLLRGMESELSAVRRRRRVEGWTEELVGRALATFRLAGSFALSRQATQTAAGAARHGHEGQLVVRGGWLRTKQVLVSGSVTAEAVRRELARADVPDSSRARLEELLTALTRFATTRYGRHPEMDETGLDGSLAGGVSLVRRLRFEHHWIVKQLRALRGSVRAGTRPWSR